MKAAGLIESMGPPKSKAAKSRLLTRKNRYASDALLPPL
jgi:hypothetical protein